MSDESSKTVTFEDIERRHIGDHNRAYYPWLRHVVTLALAALTSLVALQGHYVPATPRLPMALAVGWVALGVCILSGLYALRSEYATHLNAVADTRRRRAQFGDAHVANEMNSGVGHAPPPLHKWAVRLMVASFVVAMSSICAFAIVNLPGVVPNAS